MDARVRWLQIRWPTTTTMLELPICLGIIGAMASVGAHSFIRIQQHLQVLEAESMAVGPIVSTMEYRAITGKWPATCERAACSTESLMPGSRLKSTRIRDGGAVDLTFSSRAGDLSGKVLTFRAWVGRDAGLPVAWSCGHARVPPLTATSVDRTTLNEDELSSACRSRR
jgi:Pilin (bacterial filament)